MGKTMRWVGIIGLAFLAIGVSIPVFSQREIPMVDYVFPLDPKTWGGASPTSASGALRWEFAKQRGLQIKEMPHDWTGYNALVITLRCSKPSGSKLYVIIPSEDPAKEGMDYYTVSLTLDFDGEKTFEIPFDEMGKVRNPVGWHKVDALSFNSRWGPDDAPDPEIVLTFMDVRLRAGAKVKGPRMTDEQLFATLDLDRPGLEKVKAAVSRKDWKSARHELAEHVRRRESPRWFVDPRKRPTQGLPPVKIRAEKGKGGRFAARLTPDWSGWKRISLPKNAFEKQGNPVGWDGVSGLRIQMVGHSATRFPDLVIHLDDIRLIGPNVSYLVSDFEREPIGWKGLVQSEEQAREGRRSGKWWFMTITPVVTCDYAPRDWSRFERLEFWLFVNRSSKAQIAVVVESDPPDTTFADMVLAHRFYMGSFKDHVYDFGPRIDWSCNAMSEGESKTIEWNAQLNRHFHFSALYRAYWATGDEKYAKELADQIMSWVEDCPVLLFRSGNSPYHHAWETLNTAVRLEGEWPNALYHCLHSPSFTDDVIVTMMKSMAEQARHLVKWPTAGNWLTAESTGIYTVGTIFPEFKEAASWRKLAIERLYKQLEDEVYPDGLEYELALGYNLWVLSEYILVLEIARLNDALGEFPADYLARIEKMYNYLMYDCMPDGVAVGLNDSGNANVRQKLIEGYRYFPHRADFPYVASNGLLGKPPEHTSYAFPYTGHYVMRSGWDRDARFLHLDAGLFGFSHQHEDKLHFIVYAYGKQLLLDAGNYMYDASRWRRYVLSTRGHNTMLVDGEGQNRRRQKETHVWPRPWSSPAPPADTRFVATAGFDYAIGFYRDGYGPQMDKSVTHTRQIYFAKPDYWIVLDTLRAADAKKHTCDSLFHIAATDAAIDEKSKAVFTRESKDPNLAIVPWAEGDLRVAVVKGLTEEPVQGWSSVNGPWRPVPTAIFSREWKGATQLAHVIYPAPPGAPFALPKISRLDVKGSSATAFCLQRAGHPKEYLALQLNGGSQVQTSVLTTDAEAAFACPQVGSDFRLCMGMGRQLAAEECEVALTKAGNVSVEGVAQGTYLLNYEGDAADVCDLRVPEKGAARVYRLDGTLARQGEISVQQTDERLRIPVEPHAFYEVAFGAAKPLKVIKQEQSETAVRQKVGVDFPVRPQDPLPPTKGVKVVIQAEDFTAQGGGAVTITDKKVNIQGKAFLNWDNPGHWVEWKISVPQDGEYRIALKCCTEAMAPQRALILDGAFPNETCRCLDLPCTGGYSNERDDWKTVVLCDPKTQKPIPFYLRAGEHTLRLVNLQDSMNLDTITLFSPDAQP